MAHAVDVFFQFLVGIYRHMVCKGVVVVAVGKEVLSAILSVLGSVQQRAQCLLLHLFGMGGIALPCLHSACKYVSYNLCD